MPTWLWGVLIWFALLALFVARWDWSRASKPADTASELDSRIDNSDLNDLLARATAAATGVDQEQP
jgi:hypothetical protein